MESVYKSLKSDPHFFNRESSFYKHLQNVRDKTRYSRMIMLTVPLDDREYYTLSNQDYYNCEDENVENKKNKYDYVEEEEMENMDGDRWVNVK